MTTFISYSRVHSQFVVRLARDLKTSGFDVWLDQLDIPKGARWDDEIEAAVKRSSAFMIVLAPESIESQNVKDELSYAIDAGKHILPVVIKPCKIPLRLRRFQYVDFTDKPYKESLSEIKHLLSNTKRLVNTHVQETFGEEDGSAPRPAFVAPPSAKETDFPAGPPDHNRALIPISLRKWIVPIVLALIAIGVVVAGLAFAGNRNVAPPAASTSTPHPPTQSPTNTSTATPVPPRSEIIYSAGVPMRLIAAGEFIMGSETGMTDESPAQTMYLEAFYIDKYEVTNALYRSCVEAGACQPPGKPGSTTRADYYTSPEFDNYPVLNVDWNMARSYCEWRQQGARLPTEAEWEKAARGIDGRTYPWGEEISCNEANYFGCQNDTAPVSGSGNGLSVYGVHGMAGNVAEWVSSIFMPYPYDPDDGREDPNSDAPRVIRGGAWLNSDGDNEVRSARRQTADPLTGSDHIGFRCAFSAIILETGGMPTATPTSTAGSPGSIVNPTRTREAEDADPASNAPITATAQRTPTRTATARPTDTAEPPTNTPVPPSPTDPPPTDPPTAPPTDPPPTDPPAETPTP